jgi:hypothetical protein
MRRRGDPGKNWLTFLQNHREVIAAFDFFAVPAVTFPTTLLLFAIEHGRRRILHFNVTDHQTADWVVQQLREAFPEAGPYRYAIFDRDSTFTEEVVTFLEATGLKAKRTSVGALAEWNGGKMGGGAPIDYRQRFRFWRRESSFRRGAGMDFPDSLDDGGPLWDRHSKSRPSSQTGPTDPADPLPHADLLSLAIIEAVEKQLG